MENSYSEEYKEKKATGTLQKKYLERSYKIARSMFDSLPPRESSLFHPRNHDDKIEIEITTLHPYSRSLSQNNPQTQSVSRTPKNTSLKTNNSNFSYTSSKSVNKSPIKNQNQSHVSEPSSAKKSKNYYHFLDEYSSSFMNSMSSSPDRSPSYMYKYGNGHNSYYYTEYEPRVSKHFSPSKQQSSPIMPNFSKSHTSPPNFRYQHHIPNDYESSNFHYKNINENDERKNVGVQRTDAGKYQYEEESFTNSKNAEIIEEEEEINDDNDIDGSFKMTSTKLSDILNDEQLAKDRELLKQNLSINFHHERWNGEAEPNPEIDDTKLDQRVKMIISKLKEQNSFSAQNSRLNNTNENENVGNSDDDIDDVIFLNDDIDKNEIKNQDSSKKPNFNEESAKISKQNMKKIYSTDSSLPQNLIGTQIDYAYEVADKITHDTNQRIIDLNNK